MHSAKICFKCNEEKTFSAFYPHQGMTDGVLNKCKECTKKDVAENRNKNIDYYLEFDKRRANNPARVDARLKYSKTADGIKAGNEAKVRWTIANKLKRSATSMLRSFVRNGKIIKPSTCSVCGEEKKRIEGHHDDYAYPLSVRWLCSKCHRAWHKENGVGLHG